MSTDYGGLHEDPCISEITQAFTRYDHPQDNADTERLMRTPKEELLWLREWTSPLELARTSAARIA